MEIRDLLTRGVRLIVDPRSLKMSLDDFLASYGGYLENIVAVVKDMTGRVFYPSKVAPVDEEYPTFFTELVDATEAVGIPLGAYLNVFADAFFTMDEKFKTYSSNKVSLDTLVCPNKPEFHQHLSTVIKEITQFPIQTLFLGQIGYANDNFCYCSECRAEFTEFAELRHDLQIADPAANPALYEKWIDWRVNKITNIVHQLVSVAKEQKPDLKIIPTFPVDPEIGYLPGVRTHLGLDLDAITQGIQHLAVEVLPWTPILPEQGSSDFTSYVENLSFIQRLRRAEVEVMMTHWLLEDETEYLRAKALADAVEVEKIYAMLDYPTNYYSIREIHLNLSR